MSKKPDGGLAFPSKRTEMIPTKSEGDFLNHGEQMAHDVEYPGLTIRDYFAGQAVIMHRNGDSDNWNPKSLAKFAYEVADAMIEERDKE